MGLFLPHGRRGRRDRAARAVGAAAGAPRKGGLVTDRIALGMGLVLAVLSGADIALTGGESLLFLARKFLDLMDWVEFWR